MASILKIYFELGIIYAIPRGRINLTDAYRFKNVIKRETLGVPSRGLILDVRNSTIEMSIEELVRLSSKVSWEERTNIFRIAVVARVEEHAKSDYFAVCCTNRGNMVKAFLTVHSAVEWINRG